MKNGGFLCGPAKGTAEKPYRCICCRRCYADIDALAVSICWDCSGGNPSCKSCRSRGIFVSDFRVGRWRKYGKTMRYYAEGGLGHRLASLSRTNVIASCGERIPKAHWGGGVSVVPPCPECWPDAVTA